MASKRFSKRVVKYMLIFLVFYTLCMMYITYKTGYENSSLNQGVFGFCGVEGGILGLLKYFERKKKGDNNEV